MRQVYRWRERDAIELNHKSTLSTPLIKLERWVEELLVDNPMFPSFLPGPREDLGLLGCRYPRDTESMFGFEDKDEENPILQVRLFEAKHKSSVSWSTKDTAPTNHWKREIRRGGGVDVGNTLDWLDLRGKISIEGISPAGVTHFLRSVLGSDHRASPWLSSTCSQITEDAQTVVILVDRLDDTLLDFRVNDVCPSWYLFGSLNAHLPVNFLEDAVSRIPCGILIYRLIPPRDYLTHANPLTKVEAPAGCLWQTLTKYKDDEPFQEQQVVGPPYISPSEYGNLLNPLIESSVLNVIEKEARSIAHWTAWPESEHYQAKDGGPAPWNVFPLCYCFPATDVSKRVWIPQTCALAPQTVAHLKAILGDTLRTALFSRLDPESCLEAHNGWEDLANHVYRLHLPLVVPPGGLNGTWVDGCVETQERGRLLLFDDSKTHRAFNYSSEERIVLILDVARVEDLPVGTATGGHSAELDKFIEKMGI